METRRREALRGLLINSRYSCKNCQIRYHNLFKWMCFLCCPTLLFVSLLERFKSRPEHRTKRSSSASAENRTTSHRHHIQSRVSAPLRSHSRSPSQHNRLSAFKKSLSSDHNYICFIWYCGVRTHKLPLRYILMYSQSQSQFIHSLISGRLGLGCRAMANAIAWTQDTIICILQIKREWMSEWRKYRYIWL